MRGGSIDRFVGTGNFGQVRDGRTDRFVGAGNFDQVRDGSTDQFIGAGVLTRCVTAVLTDLLGLGFLNWGRCLGLSSLHCDGKFFLRTTFSPSICLFRC